MNPSPSVTVIIPVRNEARYIGKCLEALSRTNYPKERLEILVVDGESEDKTCPIARQFLASGLPIKILKNPRRSRCAALNTGISAAQGDIIMRLDARSIPPADYVPRCVDTLLKTGIDNVGGVMRPIHETTTQEAIGLAMSHPFGVGDVPFRLGRTSGYVDAVYLGCFRREVFDRVGLFDEAAAVISEDSDLNQRIRESGGKVYLDSQIEIYFYPRDNFADLWRLYFRYGGARVGNILKHGKPTALRQLIPATFLLALGVLGISGLFYPWLLYTFLGLVATYVACDVTTSGTLSIAKRKLALLPRLLVAFPCMHFAYAFGFVRRLIQRPRPGTYWGY